MIGAGLFRRPYTVKRLAAGSYTNGIYADGSASTFTIYASVQPLKGLEIMLLPENRRLSQAVKIFTSTLLNITSTANPDQILYNGNYFEVVSAEPWQCENKLVDHYRCIAWILGNQ